MLSKFLTVSTNLFISVGVAGPARAHQGAVGDGERCGKLVRAHFKGDFRG